MDQTERFSLPFLAPGQLQKELFHNEALQTVDMLLCPLVEGSPSASAPIDPVPGSCFLVGTGAGGAWSGQAGAIACFTRAGWKFVAPAQGIRPVDRASGQWWNWRDGTWELGILRGQELRVDGLTVVRNRQAAIAGPSGGASVDDECRVAVGEILAAMRAHGLIG